MFVDYELNPGEDAEGKERVDPDIFIEKKTDPDIYVSGYAGAHGVLRLEFELINDLSVGPGRAPRTIFVDTDYWVPPELQEGHLSTLDDLMLGRPRYLVFLEKGVVDGHETGAFRFWDAPMGLMWVGPDGVVNRLVPATTDLLEAGAAARGDGEAADFPGPEQDPAEIGGSDDGRTPTGDVAGVLEDIEGENVDQLLRIWS